jgi:hypothetical protein
MASCHKAAVREEKLFRMAKLRVRSLIKGLGRALPAFIFALTAAGGATAQVGGDCFGPSLPPELNNFGSPPTPALAASPEIGHVGEARLPMGQSVYLHLTPMSSFHPVAPVRFVTGTWKTAPVAAASSK